jgi:hypothetical protein
MAVGIWNSFKLFENVLISTKLAIHFCTEERQKNGNSSEVNGNPTYGRLVLLACDTITQRMFN